MIRPNLAITAALSAIAVAATATIVQAQSHADWLNDGETISYREYLRANDVVSAYCDEDCYNLDIFLYNAHTGRLVTSDTLTDAVPVVVVPSNGDFIVEVVMVECSLSPCAIWTDVDTSF
jgi:hypothetical protein